ncbi:MAG: sigma-70 family RNA polymerase sigma factor [Verrucomicrobiae bacterium]|nr:sigma-70 family RNA polymerase sigma factor [Verrucomicrobiae bacterium]
MHDRGSKSFPTTRWTLILDLQGGSESQRERALEELCQLYWFPIYGYVRQRGKSPEEAQDLTQSFFAQLLAGGGFERADAEKGKLRSYLLGAASRFIAKEWRRESAQKRGPGSPILSIDHAYAESRLAQDLVDGLTPEKAYDRRWAQTLLEGVAEALKCEYHARGRSRHHDLLSNYLFWNSGEPSYTEVAETLGMTEAAVRQAVLRMRKRYGVLLRDHISFTVDHPDKIDDEVQELFAAFRRDSGGANSR